MRAARQLWIGGEAVHERQEELESVRIYWPRSPQRSIGQAQVQPAQQVLTIALPRSRQHSAGEQPQASPELVRCEQGKR